MILRLAQEQAAQTLPFTAGVIFLIMAVLMMSLAVSSLSVESADQQAAADAAALAGADVLAQARQTIEIIDFLIWLRDLILDVLYAAVTIADVASLGSATGLFDIPLDFQNATEPMVSGLYDAKEVVKEIAPVYAIGAGISYIQANNTNGYYGLALPMPLTLSVKPPSAAEKSLRAEIKRREREIGAARREMDKALIAYYQRKKELKQEGVPAGAAQSELRDLLTRVRRKSGRLGGLTAVRNKKRRRLRSLEASRGRYLHGGADGVIAVVAHRRSVVPFTAFFGGADTGFNVTIAAARPAIGPADQVVGETALRNLFAGTPVLNKAAGALAWMLEAINIFQADMTRLGKKYGPVGKFLLRALRKFKLLPPRISAVRPVLTNTESVSRQTLDKQLGGFAGKVRRLLEESRKIEEKYGK